jgi:hypothetical protein
MPQRDGTGDLGLLLGTFLNKLQHFVPDNKLVIVKFGEREEDDIDDLGLFADRILIDIRNGFCPHLQWKIIFGAENLTIALASRHRPLNYFVFQAMGSWGSVYTFITAVVILCGLF